jgi:hypothetical protein
MGRNKTTGEQTRRFSFGLHPQYTEDERAIAIIDELVTKGFSVRQIMTDALLRCGGYSPEMFSNRDGLSADVLETMFNRFATEIVAEVGRRGDVVVEEEIPEADESEMWVNNFAKGFLARQQQVLGDGEDD